MTHNNIKLHSYFCCINKCTGTVTATILLLSVFFFAFVFLNNNNIINNHHRHHFVSLFSVLIREKKKKKKKQPHLYSSRNSSPVCLVKCYNLNPNLCFDADIFYPLALRCAQRRILRVRLADVTASVGSSSSGSSESVL